MPNKEGTPAEPAEPVSLPSPGGALETSTGEGSDEGQNIPPDPASQPPAPVDPYAGTVMAGKTDGEIRAYLTLLEGTVREQSTALTAAAQAPAPPAAPPEEETDFFTSPRQVIREELKELVQPINDQIAAFTALTQEEEAWKEARAAISDFAQYESYVKQMLQGQNIRPDQVNVELLKSLYYTAVGYVVRHGGQQPGETTMGHPQAPPVRQVPPVGVPQHRPSSAPLPTPPGQQVQPLRKLDENEARLAREWGMSHEEYLAYQSAEAEDVLSLDVGGKDA